MTLERLEGSRCRNGLARSPSAGGLGAPALSRIGVWRANRRSPSSKGSPSGPMMMCQTVEAPGMWRAYSNDGVFPGFAGVPGRYRLLATQARVSGQWPFAIRSAGLTSPARPHGQRAEDHAFHCDVVGHAAGLSRGSSYTFPASRQRRWHHQMPEVRLAPLAHAPTVSNRQRGSRHRVDRIEPGRRHPVRPAFGRAGLENSPDLLRAPSWSPPTARYPTAAARLGSVDILKFTRHSRTSPSFPAKERHPVLDTGRESRRPCDQVRACCMTTLDPRRRGNDERLI